jgi:hypothetical protein
LDKKQSPECGDLVTCNTLGRHTGIVVEIVAARAYTKTVYMVMIDGELIPFLSKNIKVLRND